MKKLLALLLSFSLLFSSVTPSLAGGIPVRGVTRIVRIKPVELRPNSYKGTSYLANPAGKLFRMYVPGAGVGGSSAVHVSGFQLSTHATAAQVLSATNEAVLGGFSVTPLKAAEQGQYIYHMLMPSLLGTGLVPSTAQMMETEAVLEDIVTGAEVIEQSISIDLVERTNALTTYAVIAEDPQATVELAKKFLSRNYGELGYYADNVAISVGLLSGEEGKAFLREIAAQRQSEGAVVAAGWREAKNAVADLPLSDELIGDEVGLDVRGLKELQEARLAVQEKFKQAAAQLEVTDQLSINATATAPRVEVAGARATAAEMPELGERADLSMGTSEIPSGLDRGDPRLHDTEKDIVSNGLLDYEGGVADAREVSGVDDPRIVDFAENGFLLTLDEGGREKILPVNLTVSNRFLNRSIRSFFTNHSRTPYNRVTIKSEPLLKKGKYVLEMRNQTRKPDSMDHFYLQLQNSDVGLLAEMLKREGVENFYLKLEESPNKKYKALDFEVFKEGTTEKLPFTVSVPLKNVVPGAQLVLMQSGELGWILPGQTKAVPETKLYVRIPKNQLTHLVETLQVQPANSAKLNISLRSTQNGAKFISTWISASNLSLGKTFGAPASSALEISQASARNMMMGINYVLPGLASLLTPILKKYGERKVMTFSVMLSFLSGVLATAGGFYGMIDGVTLGPVQKALFVTALLSMSVSSILKQVTTNLLIRANGGEVEYKKIEETELPQEVKDESPSTLVKRRLSEVAKETFWPIFAKEKYAQWLKEHGRKDQEQLSHLIRYNLGFIFKNVGTLAFLALPYGLNVVGGWLGQNWNLDFSASFPIYAAYSGVMTWRMLRAKLRDAYSAKNVTQSQHAIGQAVEELQTELIRPRLDLEEVDVKTRALYDALDSYVLAQQKVGSKLKHKELYAQATQEAVALLREGLTQKLSPKRVNQLVEKIETDLNKLDNRLKNMWAMVGVEGVLPLTMGMTAATVHEFVVSSSFADTMNDVIPAGDLANFLVALTLYVPMIAGRIGGNWMSKKLSKGSMYLFCSTLSAIGTAMIGLSGGHVRTMIIGAALASVGMGNFYTQMYNYITEKHKKYNREISALLSLTMAFGGLGAMVSPTSLGLTGNPAWDMAFAGGLLVLSCLLTKPMFASSSLVKAMKDSKLGRLISAKKQRDMNSPLGQAIQQKKKDLKNKVMHRNFPPVTEEPSLDDAAGAQ